MRLWPKDVLAAQLDPFTLCALVIVEGSRSFLHRNVDEDNKLKQFKPYKDLCAHIASELKACDKSCKQPRSFATTLIELAHSLEFAMHQLPALTELSVKRDGKQLAAFLFDLTERYMSAPKSFVQGSAR